ncbi:MAG TPA: septum formation initiator family protein [Holophagaceae bacterium]|jgi:cell division protein FtsB|nr:septum formation initiator family protein [Holophagaceae bacterium]
MNINRLLESRTLWAALGISALMSGGILWLAPGGLRDLGRQQVELRDATVKLRALNQNNHELYDEVRRLAAQDPELMETLARRQGYARPGETVYTFRKPGTK